MAEKEVTEYSKKKRIREPPSVPFLWEEKPGIAKKDWKPDASPIHPTLPPKAPVKLVASVPFDWEEKPGKPLACFSLPSSESSPPPPSIKLMNLLPPPIYYEGNYDGCNSNNDKGDSCYEQDGMFDLDFEAFGFDTDDSFSSAPSLLANCLVSSATISTAVPVQETPQTNTSSDHLETPSSPASETDSSTSSYATGVSSLVGASFLECLFPLLPPSSSFLEKTGCPDHGSQTLKEFDNDSNSTVLIRRPTTLGELIMMSRRRSYRRKAVQLRKQNLSMEIMKKASGCSIFGTSIKLIEGLQWKKFQPRLKLL